MSATTAAVVVSVTGMVLVAALVVFALLTKGNVRASGRVGTGSFNIDTTEKSK